VPSGYAFAKREGLVMIPVTCEKNGGGEGSYSRKRASASIYVSRGRRSIGDEWCKYKNEQICEHRRVLFGQKLSSRIPKGNIQKPSTEASGKMHQRLGGILDSGYQAVAEVWTRVCVSISRDGGYKWIAAWVILN